MQHLKQFCIVKKALCHWEGAHHLSHLFFPSCSSAFMKFRGKRVVSHDIYFVSQIFESNTELSLQCHESLHSFPHLPRIGLHWSVILKIETEKSTHWRGSALLWSERAKAGLLDLLLVFIWIASTCMFGDYVPVTVIQSRLKVKTNYDQCPECQRKSNIVSFKTTHEFSF